MEVVGSASSVTQKLFSELQRPELKEVFAVYGYKSELEKLQSTVDFISEVLHCAETMEELRAGARLWIENLKYGVFRVDDLLDEFVTLFEQKKHTKADGSISNKVRLVLSATPFDVFKKMLKKVKEIRKILDVFASDKHLCLMEFHHQPIMKMSYERRSYADVDDIVGRENDLEKIVGKLIDSDVQNDVSILSIVGMGGIGKTALAKLIYNDKRATSAFSLRLWPCVSDQDQKFGVDRILSEIFALCTHQNHESSSRRMQRLQSELQKKLSYEKYLLILDDVNWTEDRDQLDDLVRLLKVGVKGSWIVLTTRSEQTAEIMGCDSIYKLQGLDLLNSWSLFKKVAYDSEHSYPHEDPELEIGKKIVKACAGVPLALRVAGSLVYGQDMNTKQAVIQKFGEADMIKKDGILQLLKLNCKFLPSTLKNCFSYCAIFPKNYRMEKNELISLWMAQNYIVPLYEGQSIEDAGEEYFSILLWRCFFHDIIKDDETGEVLSVKMHELLYDLAQYISRNEICTATTLRHCNLYHRVRHLSISDGSKGSIFLLGVTHIRSYIEIFEDLAEKEGEFPYVETLVNSCRFLRTLKLKSKYLPSSIGRLLHLRYLNLAYNFRLEVLPSSITELFNLENLILTNCRVLIELPKDLSRLTKLRVLDISGCYSLKYMPKNMSNLTCIKRLSDFIVGGEESYSSWRELFLGLEELKDLNKLEGALNIKINFPINVTNFTQKVPDQQKGMYLRDKNDLNRIAIRFEGHHIGVLGDAETIKLMEDLQAPPNLKFLNVCGYNGTRMPKWISFFPCLVTLQLKRCYMFEYLETSGNGEGIFLPNLRTLELVDMFKLKGWSRGVGVGVGVEESSNSQLHLLSSLPHLENLVIQLCPKLMRFPLCHEVEIVFESPKLRYVQIDDVAWLNSLPTEAFQCLETLQIISFYQKVKNLGEVEKVFRACSSSLQFLKIRNCCELRSVFVGGLEHLSALKTLEIIDCDKLEPSEQIEHPSFLPSLHTLKLEYLPKMLNLPNWMQFLPTIQTLEIHHCKNLKAMPNWMSKLMNLKKLIVKRCSERLERRCKIQGKDWPFIQHIPTINFKDCSAVSTFSYEGEQAIMTDANDITLESENTAKRRKINNNEQECRKNADDVSPSPAKEQQNEEHKEMAAPIRVIQCDRDGTNLNDSIKASGVTMRTHALNHTDDETNTSTVESIPQLDGKSLPKTTGNRWLTLSWVFKAIHRMKVIAYQKREELKLHCSIFPSGYEFEREKLIQLWMAVGFFEIEEVGNIKYDVLVEQNCILLAGTNILTGKNKYKFDFDKFTSAFNDILEDDQKIVEDESEFWHISVVSDHIDQTVFEGLKNFRELRTLLFTRNYGSSLKQVSLDMFLAFQTKI